MVRLKIAYLEFDFEAVCPTLDHDLLSHSQAHITYIIIYFIWIKKHIHDSAVINVYQSDYRTEVGLAKNCLKLQRKWCQ